MIKKIPLKNIATITLLSLFLVACNSKKQDPIWAEETASISTEAQSDGQYSYTISYQIPESTAMDANNKPIKDPVEQHGLSEKKPVNGQKIKLRYMKEEPVIFELLEPMKYEK